MLLARCIQGVISLASCHPLCVLVERKQTVGVAAPYFSESRIYNGSPLFLTQKPPFEKRTIHKPDGYRIRRCISPPTGAISWSISPQFGSCRCQKGRHWKHLAESFPKTCRSGWTPSWLSSNRAWKTAPGECYIHRRIRYHGLSIQRVPFKESVDILAIT